MNNPPEFRGRLSIGRSTASNVGDLRFRIQTNAIVKAMTVLIMAAMLPAIAGTFNLR